MAYGEDDRTLAAEELAFLARMRDWTRQWGEREYYYIVREDLEYAISHNLCTILVFNKPQHDGPEKQYLFFKNLIMLVGKYYVNTDRRMAGN